MIEERAKELNHGIVRILDFMTKNVKMSPYQQAVVSVALQNLANIPEEIKNLGLIVNAASYLERHDGSAGYIRPSCDAIKKTHGMSMNPSVQAIVQECQK